MSGNRFLDIGHVLLTFACMGGGEGGGGQV